MTDPLDPQLMLEITRRAKVQLRRRLKDLRGSYPRTALARRSELIKDRLLQLPELEQARGVALFYPLIDRGEVDLRTLDEELRRRRIDVYYPFMRPGTGGSYTTGFGRSAELAELSERRRGFPEPPIDAHVALPGELDLVVVPALAADGSGYRLGYGSGFYDATLTDVAPPARSVVVVFDFQLLAEIPSEAHDVRCNIVVTDERVVRPTP
jgi:5-formyltetrahydrofolate cyclo-ligase